MVQESIKTESDYRLKELERRLGFVDRSRLLIARDLVKGVITDSVRTETDLREKIETLNEKLLCANDKFSKLTAKIENVLIPRTLNLENKLKEGEKARKTVETLRQTEIGILAGYTIHYVLTGGNPTNMSAFFLYHEKIQRARGEKSLPFGVFNRCMTDFKERGIIQTQIEGGVTTYRFPFPLPINEVQETVKAYAGAKLTELEDLVLQLQGDKEKAYKEGVNTATQKFEGQITTLQAELDDYRQKVESGFPSEQGRNFYNLLRRFSGKHSTGIGCQPFYESLSIHYSDMNLTMHQVQSHLDALVFFGLAGTSSGEYTKYKTTL